MVAWLAPSHYSNQCGNNIVNSKLRNKLQWNLKWTSYIFFQENAFENVVCKMAAILSHPQCALKMPLLKSWVSPNDWQFKCLLNRCSGWQQFYTKAEQYWPFVRRITGSPHKGPVMLKPLSCQETIMARWKILGNGWEGTRSSAVWSW